MIDYEATIAAMHLGATVTLSIHKANVVGFISHVTQVQFLVTLYNCVLPLSTIAKTEDAARWVLRFNYQTRKNNLRFTYGDTSTREAVAYAVYELGHQDAPALIAALDAEDADERIAAIVNGDSPRPSWS